MAPKIKDWAPRSLSEYSYGQQMTTEVVDHVGGRSGLAAAPLVPSLQAEEDVGFDVKIAATWVTLFLQYKVSAQLTRTNAAQAYRMGVPYFRFPVRTGRAGDVTCQHNVLRGLQQQLIGHMAFVYYAAPVFVFAAWDRLALNHQVADNSIFIPPMEMDEVVPGQAHCFAYTGTHDARSFSEPVSAQAASLSSVLEGATAAFERADQREPERIGQYLSRTYALLIDAGLWVDAPPYQGPRSVALAASRLDLQAIAIGQVEPGVDLQSPNRA